MWKMWGAQWFGLAAVQNLQLLSLKLSGHTLNREFSAILLN